MKHLLNLLRGAGEIFRIAPEPRGYRVDQDGFRTDAARLQGDFRAVGNDLRRTIKRAKSTNDRPR